MNDELYKKVVRLARVVQELYRLGSDVAAEEGEELVGKMRKEDDGGRMERFINEAVAAHPGAQWEKVQMG